MTERPRKRRVAAFSCPCGAQDEVREPAPERVDCWSCKRPRSARRWTPAEDPPFLSARKATAEEIARIGKPDDVAEAQADAPNKRKSAPKAKPVRWIENLGEQPRPTRGKRVRVKIGDGTGEPVEPRYADALDPMAPPGWAADKADWRKRGSPFDIRFWAFAR